MNFYFSCRDKIEHDMVDPNFSKITFSPKVKVKIQDTNDWHSLFISFIKIFFLMSQPNCSDKLNK